jgi:hypothetical protein
MKTMKPINIQPTPVEPQGASPFSDTPAEQGTPKTAYDDSYRRPRNLWRSPLAAHDLLAILMGQGGRLSLVDRTDHLPGIVQQRLWLRMREGL